VQQTDKRFLWAFIAIVAGLLMGIGFYLSKPAEKTAPSWSPTTEGFLAVPTPCCSEALLWDSLDEITSDGQRARPATAAEAARWLNQWPARRRAEEAADTGEELGVAAQSSEVRCKGAPTGPEVPHSGNDEETVKALRQRPECTYVKWKIWNAETAKRYSNERHVVWADEKGFLHGRVEYWK
jgi:hypothetical protein